jgi:hypothetical protein
MAAVTFSVSKTLSICEPFADRKRVSTARARTCRMRGFSCFSAANLPLNPMRAGAASAYTASAK